ncbi:hypothetical protein AAOE16_10340 [Ekhidna sp. MALMAid0563]|uniref:hypothetical protein n=1 Tax=Ekhidna sp. MALMAid0563 TaxID=3143937 RepID=UPI0032DF6F62
MRFLITIIVGLTICTGCKRQTTPAKTNNIEGVRVSYHDYTPNPDEVVLEVKFISGEFDEKLWRNEMTVIRQIKSGFGYKDRIRPGTSIILLSREKLSQEQFFCSAEYQLSVNNQSHQTFVLRQYLTQ